MQVITVKYHYVDIGHGITVGIPIDEATEDAIMDGDIFQYIIVEDPDISTIDQGIMYNRYVEIFMKSYKEKKCQLEKKSTKP